MKFETFKTKVMQSLADNVEAARANPRKTHEGLSQDYLQRAFDKFSYNELAQHQAYAVCDGEEPQDLISIIHICTI